MVPTVFPEIFTTSGFSPVVFDHEPEVVKFFDAARPVTNNSVAIHTYQLLNNVTLSVLVVCNKPTSPANAPAAPFAPELQSLAHSALLQYLLSHLYCCANFQLGCSQLLGQRYPVIAMSRNWGAMTHAHHLVADGTSVLVDTHCARRRRSSHLDTNARILVGRVGTRRRHAPGGRRRGRSQQL